MEVEEYLKKYDREEHRLVSWLLSSGANVAIALEKLSEYASTDRQFQTGSELDHTLLKESLQAHIDKIKSPSEDLLMPTLLRLVELYEADRGINKPKWYDKIWQLITKALSQRDTG